EHSISRQGEPVCAARARCVVSRTTRSRLSKRSAISRAGGLHSRTIEVLDQRGIAEFFLSQGQVAQVAQFAWIPRDISDFPPLTFYCPAVVDRTRVPPVPPPATNTVPEGNPVAEAAMEGSSGDGLIVHCVPSQCSINVSDTSMTSTQGPQPTAHTLLLETAATPKSALSNDS